MKAETLQCVDGPLDGQYQTLHEGNRIVFTNDTGDWTYEKRHRDGRDVWALTGVHVRFTHSRPAFEPRTWPGREAR